LIILKAIVLSLLVSILIFQISCVPENEILSTNPNYQLIFSKDTVSFDTVFTTLGSVSKRLIVHNPHPNAVEIENVYIGKGTDSQYDITVSGKNQKVVENQVIMGNDSLLVLVTVSIDPNEVSLPFVVRDSIVFVTNGNQQDVKLQSWGQNAHFLGDSILACDAQWKPDKPYYLYGSILVDSLCTLTIDKGVQIYAAFNSFVFIKGTLLANGDSQERILFRNERLEERYENIPGQWGGIFFLEGSKNNIIEYTDIRNVQYGLRVGTPDKDTIPDLIIRNTRIENTSVGGILTYSSDLMAVNTLVNTSTGYNVANFAGGNYIYQHCTFANYPISFFQESPSVIFTDNVVLENDEIITEAINLHLYNTIVWGNLSEEIYIDTSGGSEFILRSYNSILKSSLDIFEGSGNYLSTDTEFMQFQDYNNYDYTPDSLSPAIDNARKTGLSIDLFGFERDSLPDIGAIEFLK